MNDLDLLGPAIEAARKALRRLDEADVPAQLRKVAQSSAKTLPPPLAKVLLERLDSDEWLRAKAAAELVERSERTHGAAVAFLERADGWQDDLDSIRDQGSNAVLARRIDAFESEKQALHRKIDELSDLVAKLRRDLESERLRAEERVVGERGRISAANERLRSELTTSAKENQELLRRLLEAETRLDDQTRRERTVKKTPAPRRREDLGGFGSGAPLELARTLDRIAESAVRGLESAQEAMTRSRFTFAGNVRPDRVEAVDQVLKWAGPLSVLVDGFNLLHEMGLSIDAVGRRRVEEALREFRRRASGRMTVEVYWDTNDVPDSRRLGGITVAYVPIADDAIIERAGLDAAEDVVIVSTDREVREGVEWSGALALWSSALAAWIGRT